MLAPLVVGLLTAFVSWWCGQKTGHYDDLVRTIFMGCALFLAIALMGFALLFGVKLHPALEASLVGLHGAALVSLIDVGRKFRLVLKNLS